MKAAKYFLVSIFLVASTVFGAEDLFIEKMGGHEAGGGTTLTKTKSSNPLLLDLVAFDKDFKDNYQVDAGIPVKEGSSSALLRFELTDIESSESYKFLEKTLEKWEDSNPVLVHEILATVKSTNYIPIDAYLPTPMNEDLGVDILKLKRDFPDGVIHRAATYTFKDGALLSLSVWNKLGDYSRIGLLVHEALRRMQILNKESILTSKIVGLTGVLILGNPENIGNAEFRKYLPESIIKYSKLVNESIELLADVKVAVSELDESGFTKRTLESIEEFNLEQFLSSDVQRRHYVYSIISELRDANYKLKCDMVHAYREGLDLEVERLDVTIESLKELIDRLLPHHESLMRDSGKRLDQHIAELLRAGNPLTNNFYYGMSKDLQKTISKVHKAIIKGSEKRSTGIAVSSLPVE